MEVTATSASPCRRRPGLALAVSVMFLQEVLQKEGLPSQARLR